MYQLGGQALFLSNNDIQIGRGETIYDTAYEAAIKVAKLILRHFDYSIDKASDETQEVRPFCIDMPRLYEMYVLSLLRKAYGDQIQFQVKGSHKTQVDQEIRQ